MMQVNISSQYDEQFIYWLKDHIVTQLTSQFNPKKLQQIETFMNNVPEYASVYKKYISCAEIIKVAAYSLVIQRTDTSYTIYIDNNVKYAGTHIKLYDLCSLINYGILGIKGQYIFTDCFSAIEQNIDYLYSIYQTLRGI